jgi:hypothetical protein
MKTKTFLLLCLILGNGLTQLSAQNGKNGTGSVVTLETWDNYSIPVCNSDGEIIDNLAGPVTCHYVRHYNKDGVWISEIVDFYGEVRSVGLDFISGTGEVFEIKDHWVTRTIGFGGSGHCSARGNFGSHFILFYQFDSSWNFVCVNAVTPGSK